MFENRVLRRIYGLKRDEMRGSCRKLDNEELHNLYSPPSIIITMKTRRMRWRGIVARMVEKRNTYRIFVDSQKQRDQKEDQDVGGWMVLNWILER
jgi:hypothetical protein